MVALLCPNNSHIVSRTDSPCRKQQACYQSHIFAYCETPPHTHTLSSFFPAKGEKTKLETFEGPPPPLKLTHCQSIRKEHILEHCVHFKFHNISKSRLRIKKGRVACFHLCSPQSQSVQADRMDPFFFRIAEKCVFTLVRY